MEFTGEKETLRKSAKLFGTIGGLASLAGIIYLIMTEPSFMLVDILIGAVTGIAVGITYGCIRFIIRNVTPRVVIEDGMIVKEDLKKEKAPLAQIQKLERLKGVLVIHLNKGKMVISEFMGYPVDKIYQHLQSHVQLKK